MFLYIKCPEETFHVQKEEPKEEPKEEKLEK